MKKRMNIVMVALLTILASCSTNYQMVTRVHKDGTVEKEVWALADSAFLAGDSNHNPFLFRLGKDWEVEELFSAYDEEVRKCMQNTERLGRHGFLFGKGKVDASIGSSGGKTGKTFSLVLYLLYLYL